MQFKPSSLNQYYKQWESHSPIAIHQSNPQPFTLEELEAIIGSSSKILDQKLNLSYAAGQGDAELKTAITELYTHKNANNVATFAGAQEAIFCCLNTLLKADDKVVAISPIFEPLINPARDLACEIQLISLQANNQWHLDLNELEDAVKSGAKLLILNFPHNPTGAMINKEELLQIIKICDKYNCWILSDEVFRGLEHIPEDRLPSVADLYPKSISISVLSKAFATPAVRVAWINCQDQNIIKRSLQIKDYLSICNSLIDEKLATKIIQHYDEIWARNRQLISHNLQQLNQIIPQLEELDFILPTAGCICFPVFNNNSPADNYAEQLIKNHKLMILPGSLFSTYENGFRLGFGYQANIEHLQKLKKPDSSQS